MACDICGNNSGPLIDLRDVYKTEEVKQICGACERVVNKHLTKVQGVTHNILVSLMKRFILGRRKEGVGNGAG